MKRSLVATFHRVKRGDRTVATFQNSHDAICFADESSYATNTEHTIHTANHYQTDTGLEIEETLMMVSKPIKQ